MGHRKYRVEQGEILFRGQNVVKLPPHQRACLGLFLAFQYPKEIPGVKLITFLRSIHHAKQQQRDPSARKMPVAQFKTLLEQHMTTLGIDHAFADRYLNTGFSGGEKKKSEMLQMALLQPDCAILDETDSGLDIDALRLVCSSIQTVHQQTNLGVVLITHYNRILDYITPDYVHVLMQGRIARSGGPDFAKVIETKGYGWLKDSK